MIDHFAQLSKFILQYHDTQSTLRLTLVEEWSWDTHDFIRRTGIATIVKCVVRHVEYLEGPSGQIDRFIIETRFVEECIHFLCAATVLDIWDVYWRENHDNILTVRV